MANAKGFAEFVATVPTKDVGYILVAVDIDETNNMPMTIASNVQQDVARKLIKSLLRQWDDLDLHPIAANNEIVVNDAE